MFLILLKNKPENCFSTLWDIRRLNLLKKINQYFHASSDHRKEKEKIEVIQISSEEEGEEEEEEEEEEETKQICKNRTPAAVNIIMGQNKETFTLNQNVKKTIILEKQKAPVNQRFKNGSVPCFKSLIKSNFNDIESESESETESDNLGFHWGMYHNVFSKIFKK